MMAWILAIWGMVSLLYGIFLWAAGASAVHEIEAGVAFLITTVAWGLSALLDEVRAVGKILRAAPVLADPEERPGVIRSLLGRFFDREPRAAAVAEGSTGPIDAPSSPLTACPSCRRQIPRSLTRCTFCRAEIAAGR